MEHTTAEEAYKAGPKHTAKVAGEQPMVEADSEVQPLLN